VADPTLSASRLAGEPHRGDLLVVGPSLGTSVTALWSDCARALGDSFEVVGWDLPGHGRSVPATAPFSVADLARSVASVARSLLREDPVGRRCWYAGVSVGGAVGLELSLGDGPFEAVVAISAAASIGEPSAWHERAGLVRRSGTPVMVEGSAKRWFAPGFIDRNPRSAASLLNSLWKADAESYAKACEALAAYDLRARVGAAHVPVLFLPGAHDQVVTVEDATRSADAVTGAKVHVLDSCGHLGSVEDPVAVAEVLTDFFTHDLDGTR
jgi:3-oxoadipate enol-lactonase